MPLPVTDLLEVLTILSDILLMLYELVVHLLDEISTAVSELRKVHNCILYEIETVDLVLYSHIERSRDRTLFLISMNMHVLVITTIGQLLYVLIF